MMGATHQLPVTILRRQMPLDLLLRGRQLLIVPGVDVAIGGGTDVQGRGPLVGRHVVDVPRDIRRRATVANGAASLEFCALAEVTLAIWPRQQLNNRLLGTH